MSKKMEKISVDGDTYARIRFMILDVDGVMTDGAIIYTAEGDELKSFDVKDGAGIKYWLRVGHGAGIVTGRSSPAVMRRAKELGIDLVEMNAKNKLPAFRKILEKAGVTPEETVVVGDDLPDYPLVLRAGLGVAVADAVDEVREVADMVTEKRGGHGAVREVVERILKAQNRWQDILARYLTAD